MTFIKAYSSVRDDVGGDLAGTVGKTWPDPTAGAASVSVNQVFFAIAPAGATSAVDANRLVEGERRTYRKTGASSWIDLGDKAAQLTRQNAGSLPPSGPTQTALDAKPTTLGTAGSLRTMPSGGLADGRSVAVMGYASPLMPMGGGMFSWDSASTDPDDGGMIFKPDDRVGAGRWRRVGVKVFDITDFGAVPGQVSHDAINRAITAASLAGGGRVHVPYGTQPYLAAASIIAKQGVKLIGVGFDRRTLGDTPKGSCIRRSVAGFPLMVVDGSASGQGQRLRYCGMRDIMLDGNNLSGNVLELLTAQNFRMTECTLANTPNKLFWGRDFFDCRFSDNYYVGGGTAGGDPAFHIDDSLGGGSAHNNNNRFIGDTWERNYGRPILIDGKGTGPGNTTIKMIACKAENTEVNSYVIEMVDVAQSSFEFLVVTFGTVGNVLPAQVKMASVKGITAVFTSSHQNTSTSARLQAIVELTAYSQVNIEIINSGGNPVGGILGDYVFNNSSGDDKSTLACRDVGSKQLAASNALALCQQPQKIDGPGAVLARFMRAGGTAANTVVEWYGAIVDTVRQSMFAGIDANGNFGINTSTDLSSAPFKLFRSGKLGLAGTYDAPVTVAGLRIWQETTAKNSLLANQNDPTSATDGFYLTPRSVSKIIDLPSIAAGQSYTTTIAVTGVLSSHGVVADFSGGGGGLMIYAECNAADTVRIIAFNPTAAAIDLPSRTLNMRIFGVPATPLP